jgi:hypothetical protein
MSRALRRVVGFHEINRNGRDAARQVAGWLGFLATGDKPPNPKSSVRNRFRFWHREYASPMAKKRWQAVRSGIGDLPYSNRLNLGILPRLSNYADFGVGRPFCWRMSLFQV